MASLSFFFSTIEESSLNIAILSKNVTAHKQEVHWLWMN